MNNIEEEKPQTGNKKGIMGQMLKVSVSISTISLLSFSSFKNIHKGVIQRDNFTVIIPFLIHLEINHLNWEILSYVNGDKISLQ